MNWRLILSGSVLIAILGSCTGMKITTDRNEDVKFEKYLTYSVEYKGNSGQEVNDILKDRIETALHWELEVKGMEKSDKPDVVITYSLGVDVSSNYSINETGYYGRYRGGSSNAHIREYKTYNGELAISMLDAQTNKMVWFGKANRELNSNNKKSNEKIKSAVNAIMTNFPVDHQEVFEKNDLVSRVQ